MPGQSQSSSLAVSYALPQLVAVGGGNIVVHNFNGKGSPNWLWSTTDQSMLVFKGAMVLPNKIPEDRFQVLSQSLWFFRSAVYYFNEGFKARLFGLLRSCQ